MYDDRLFLFEKRLLDAVEQWYSKALSDSSIEWTLFLFSTRIAQPYTGYKLFVKEPTTGKLDCQF